jgi:dTDP-4-dehydrorhamnose reductase
MLVEVAERKIPGILHTAGATRLSRYELALQVADVFRLDRKLVMEGTAKDILWKAKRPKDSSLIVARAAGLLSEKPLPITDSLEQFQKEKNAIESREKTITRAA